MSVENRGERISRRDFNREMFAIVLGGLGMFYLGLYFSAEEEGGKCAEWLEQIGEESPGYRITELDEKTRVVELLETGRFEDTTCFPGNPYGGQTSLNFDAVFNRKVRTDISKETLLGALSEIAENYEIIEANPVDEKGNIVIVKVNPCK